VFAKERGEGKTSYMRPRGGGKGVGKKRKGKGGGETSPSKRKKPGSLYILLLTCMIEEKERFPVNHGAKEEKTFYLL